MKLPALLCSLLLSLPFLAEGRVGIMISGGWGISYVQKHAISVAYMPVGRPHMDVLLRLPLSEVCYIETGAGFRQKYFRSESVLVEDVADQTRNVYHGLARRDYLQLPLTMHYRLPARLHRFSVGAGLFYGFLLHAETRFDQDYYRKDRLVSQYSFTFQHKVGLTPSGNKTPPDRRTAILLLDFGMKWQLEYACSKHFLIQVFHEHSLYDTSPYSDGKSSLKSRYTGLSVGYIF